MSGGYGDADDEQPRCADRCGRPATDERLSDLASDGTEMVELVCIVCARAAA